MSPERITEEKLSHDKSVVVEISTNTRLGLSLEQRNDGWQFNLVGYSIYNLLEALSTKMEADLSAEEKKKHEQEMKDAKKRPFDSKPISITFSKDELVGVEQAVDSNGNFGHLNYMKFRFANKNVVTETYKMLLSLPKTSEASKR